eukprot:5218685-Amphidinium_carterae.1
MQGDTYVTGLGFKAEGQLNIVLELFHDRDFNNDVDWRYGMDPKKCKECSKLITNISRKARGDTKGWIQGGQASPGTGWDVTRECVRMTPVAPMHSQAKGIWRSGQGILSIKTKLKLGALEAQMEDDLAWLLAQGVQSMVGRRILRCLPAMHGWPLRMQCVLGTTEESNETLVYFKSDFVAFDSLQKGAQKHPDVQKLSSRSVFQSPDSSSEALCRCSDRSRVAKCHCTPRNLHRDGHSEGQRHLQLTSI